MASMWGGDASNGLRNLTGCVGCELSKHRVTSTHHNRACLVGVSESLVSQFGGWALLQRETNPHVGSMIKNSSGQRGGGDVMIGSFAYIHSAGFPCTHQPTILVVVHKGLIMGWGSSGFEGGWSAH